MLIDKCLYEEVKALEKSQENLNNMLMKNHNFETCSIFEDEITTYCKENGLEAKIDRFMHNGDMIISEQSHDSVIRINKDIDWKSYVDYCWLGIGDDPERSE